jgi:hypothetical protein
VLWRRRAAVSKVPAARRGPDIGEEPRAGVVASQPLSSGRAQEQGEEGEQGEERGHPRFCATRAHSRVEVKYRSRSRVSGI